MSLRSNLNQIIKDKNGEIFTLQELTAYCDKAKYKLSNAERRLRPSDSPDVVSVYNDKKTAIIGYRYKDSQIKSQLFNSKSSDKVYNTSDVNPGWQCGCPRYRYTGDCSHIRQLKQIYKSLAYDNKIPTKGIEQVNPRDIAIAGQEMPSLW